jgi:ppGpp synthetase/RelA/SpoT-type nucleotidyltranferase
VSGVLGPVLAGIAAVACAYLAYRQATKVSAQTSRVEIQKVDAGAYERARGIYESGIKQLEEQLSHLRKQLDEEREVSGRLRTRVSELEDIVAKMRRQMMIAGMDFQG